MPELLYLNGRVMPLEEGKVSVEDRGFQFADGVYEVAVVYSGVPYEFEEHIDRLFHSARLLELEILHPPEEIKSICLDLLAESQLANCLVYIQVTRGYARRGHAFPDEVKPTVVVYTIEFAGRAAEHYEKGVATITVPDDRWGRCNIKSIALLANCLAKEKAYRAGCYEAIFHSPTGVVYEGASTNVFCVIDGSIVTAPLSNKILPGITRARLMELARAGGFQMVERDCTVVELKGADEVFLTGTSTEVMPVIRVDDTTIGTGEPGPVSRQLRRLMLEHIQRVCGSAPVAGSGRPETG